MGNTIFVAKQNVYDAELDCRLSVKQLRVMSVRCLKQEKHETQLALKAMEEAKPEIARIHAQNSVRNRHLAERYLRLASRTESMADAHTWMRQSTPSIMSK
jgi:hypothetical protein